jgi:ParB family transcriptional regulator, chromosome partitioning protein
MTETMTADPGYGTHDNEVAQPLGGTFEHLSPTALTLGDNVRDNVALDKAFLASIKEHGVLTPVTAVRAHDGTTITVRDGQRRTLAAREVGLAAIPVYVLPATAADQSAEVVERIVHQIVANDQRADLTDAQRARGIQQMLDAGVSQAKAAKKLSVAREAVKAAAAAARSAAAMDGLASGQLSLTEAAVIAEFEGDPTAVNELVRVAGTRMFDHKVEQLRQARASAEAHAAAAAT